LILNPSGSKMSKRDEGSSIESYQQAGFLPAAVFNYLCLLGWTPRADSEKLDRDTLVSLFDAKEIHSSNARFDIGKCKWLNSQYLREMEPKALLDASRHQLSQAGLPIEKASHAAAILQSVKEKVSLLSEFPAWVHYFFRDDYPYEVEVVAKLRAKEDNSTLLEAAGKALEAVGDWTEDSIHAAIELAAKEQAVKPGALMPLLRGALSGQMRGPGVATMAHLLGKSAVLNRIHQAQNVI
ncbi:MAG: glutamate--tRNA ligase, partial [Verrucomicrobiales bacterium]|nr:glutamate--tRNA ligase [Verrucomicrobiales bacterium]